MSAKPNAIPPGVPFNPHIPDPRPLPDPKHKPGVLASPKDRAPEFHAKTLPPGSAPKDRTFLPNPINEIPTTNVDYGDDYDPDAPRARAADTLGPTTDRDLDKGLGHPIHGMTSVELRHDGQHGRKRQELGLVGVGATTVGNAIEMVNERDPIHADQRGLERDEARPRGVRGGPPAEDRPPVPPETAARLTKPKR